MPGFSLYCDEDSLDRAVIAALRQRGWDVLTTPEADMTQHPDEDQLLFAASAGRIIYTANAGDFARLHAEFAVAGQKHAGIIAHTWQQMPIGEQVRALSAVCATYDAAAMTRRFVYLEAFSARHGRAPRPCCPGREMTETTEILMRRRSSATLALWRARGA